MSDIRSTRATQRSMAGPAPQAGGDAVLIWGLALVGFLIVAFAVACAGM